MSNMSAPFPIQWAQPPPEEVLWPRHSHVASVKHIGDTNVFCNGLRLGSLSSHETAYLTTLCQCTGWSADRIAIAISDVSKYRPLAEEVWDFHCKWIEAHPQTEKNVLPDNEIEFMDAILHNQGIKLKEKGTPLYMTLKPITVEFLRVWDHKNPDGNPICTGFDFTNRERSKDFLYGSPLSEFGKLTSLEKPVIAQFGPTVLLIISDLLKRWALRMRSKLKADGILRSFKKVEHIELALDYTNMFQDAFECFYGKIELGKSKENDAICIQSTAFCAKAVFGLMMADRILVVKLLQAAKKEDISFIPVEMEEFPKEECFCIICKEKMGVPNPEGTAEKPIKLIICCGQTLGKACLKSWLERDPMSGKPVRDTCPLCRYQFPSKFFDKLFETDKPNSNREFEPQEHDRENIIEDEEMADVNDGSLEEHEEENAVEDNDAYQHSNMEDDKIAEINDGGPITPPRQRPQAAVSMLTPPHGYENLLYWQGVEAEFEEQEAQTNAKAARRQNRSRGTETGSIGLVTPPSNRRRPQAQPKRQASMIEGSIRNEDIEYDEMYGAPRARSGAQIRKRTRDILKRQKSQRAEGRLTI